MNFHEQFALLVASVIVLGAVVGLAPKFFKKLAVELSARTRSECEADVGFAVVVLVLAILAVAATYL